MRFAALGRTEMLYNSILACTNAGHEPVLIGTCPAAPEYKRTESDFKRLAKELDCPYFCDPTINKQKYVELIYDSGAQVAISVNWLTLVSSAVIEAFEHGIINAHGGDLPRYRGNACQAWAILNGEKEVVMTLHKMVEELDAGPIMLKQPYPINSETYIGEILNYFEIILPEMFKEALDGLAAGTLKEKPQSSEPEKALRCYPRQPSDGYINWSMPAEHIARLVRASAEPYAGAYTYYRGQKLIIWRAHASTFDVPSLAVPGQILWKNRHSGEVGIASGEEVIVIQEVQFEKETIRRKPTECIASLRQRLD